MSRLSSIEVLPCDNSSPFSTVSLKLKKLDGSGEDSTINISKDDVQVLLTGKPLQRISSMSKENIFMFNLLIRCCFL